MSYRLSIIAVTAYVLVGCSSSLDIDARQLAELQCRARNVADRVVRGDASATAHADSLMKQLGDLRHTLDTRYPSGSARDEFTKAYLKALEECSRQR